MLSVGGFGLPNLRKEPCACRVLDMQTAAPLQQMPTTFAKDLEPTMHIYVNGSEAVTVAEVTRRDSRWIANGVVHFLATNGRKYGLPRMDAIRFA